MVYLILSLCLWASFPCSCPTWGSMPSCCFPIKMHTLWMRMFPRFASTCALSQASGELEPFSAAASRRQSFLSSLCHEDNLGCPLLSLQICALVGEINARGFVVFHSPCPSSLTMIILRKTILHELRCSGYWRGGGALAFEVLLRGSRGLFTTVVPPLKLVSISVLPLRGRLCPH